MVILNLEEKVKELKEFELGLICHFKKRGLNVPLHLSGGNEYELIELFKQIKPEDWVFASHRNHYHALLKGLPEELVRSKILNGEGMTMMSQEYRFFGSGIVAGHLPIAVGMAKAIQLKKEKFQVWAFCGDMAASTGIFHECVKYSECQDLPINFVIEDNGVSVKSPTNLVWGLNQKNKVYRYSYSPNYPHHGFSKGGQF